MNYANAGIKRFPAFLIDATILYIVQASLNYIVTNVSVNIFKPAVDEDSSNIIAYAGISLAIYILIDWLYFAIYESSAKQATIGKKALGIVVTDIDGEKLSFLKASIRYLAKNLWVLVGLIGLIMSLFIEKESSRDILFTGIFIVGAMIVFIDYIFAFFTEKKQALHDMIAGTLVLQK